MEKLPVNTRANLALTTVLIMGSAGTTVIYVLCVFILCVRNEENQSREDREMTAELRQERLRNNRSQRHSEFESEPLISLAIQVR